MTDEQKRRRHTRVGIQLRCEIKPLKGSTDIIKGSARNISFRGLFFRCEGECPLDYGQECLVHLYLGDEETTPVIKASAKIIHKGQQGLGIEFSDLNLDSFQHLKNLLVYATDDPDKIESEIKKHN